MYVLQGTKCGTVRFTPDMGTVNKEMVNRSSAVTDNPVESGENISDHVFRQPRTIQLAGTVVDGAQAIAILDAMWKSGDVLTYTGRNRIKNLVIQQLQSTHDAKNRKGFTFTATLKQIAVGSAEDSGTASMMSAQDAAASTSSQTAKKRADGLKTTASEVISASAYAAYVDSYNKKPASSAGPSSRATPSNSGRRV